MTSRSTILDAMRIAPIVIVVASTSLVAAKPLPKGMTVTLVKERRFVSRDGVTVPLSGEHSKISKLKSAELSDDGKEILAKVLVCDGMMDDGSEPEHYSVAVVDARIENVIGMGFHNKKQYADAIKHFTIAAA